MFVLTLYYIFAAVLLAAGVGVITARNPVHSALSLVVCFVTSAALWLLIEAEFLAIVLVLVYVGAVMVLFLFVVMMLDINVEQLRSGFTRYAWLGCATTLLVIAELVGVIYARRLGIDATHGGAPVPADPGAGYANTRELGRVLYTDYVYPFELAAVVLLVAIIAAIALTLRRRKDTKYQTPSKQVAVKREDRVRLVSMPSEKKD